MMLDQYCWIEEPDYNLSWLMKADADHLRISCW